MRPIWFLVFILMLWAVSEYAFTQGYRRGGISAYRDCSSMMLERKP